MPSKSLPVRPSLAHLKYQARDLLKAVHEEYPEALARLGEFHPTFIAPKHDPATFRLSDAQFVIAREYGFESWSKLKQHVESIASHTKNHRSQGDLCLRIGLCTAR